MNFFNIKKNGFNENKNLKCLYTKPPSCCIAKHFCNYLYLKNYEFLWKMSKNTICLP